jgi:hypothetical protein
MSMHLNRSLGQIIELDSGIHFISLRIGAPVNDPMYRLKIDSIGKRVLTVSLLRNIDHSRSFMPSFYNGT